MRGAFADVFPAKSGTHDAPVILFGFSSARDTNTLKENDIGPLFYYVPDICALFLSEHNVCFSLGIAIAITEYDTILKTLN